MMPEKKPVDYVEKAVKKAAKATAKAEKAKAKVGPKAGAEKAGQGMVDVYLARLNATFYSDEYIPIAIRLAELSQKPMARDYPPLSLTDKQLGCIKVEPHVLSIAGKKERLVKTPDGEKRGVVDNALVWMVFKFPSEFNLKRDEVEDIIGLLRFGFGKYGTCKIEEFNFIGKNYAEES